MSKLYNSWSEYEMIQRDCLFLILHTDKVLYISKVGRAYIFTIHSVFSQKLTL